MSIATNKQGYIIVHKEKLDNGNVRTTYPVFDDLKKAQRWVGMMKLREKLGEIEVIKTVINPVREFEFSSDE